MTHKKLIFFLVVKDMWILFTGRYQILEQYNTVMFVSICPWKKIPGVEGALLLQILLSCKKQLLWSTPTFFFFFFHREALALYSFSQTVNLKGKTTYLRSGNLGQKKRGKNSKKQISKNDWNNKITCCLVAFFQPHLI